MSSVANRKHKYVFDSVVFLQIEFKFVVVVAEMYSHTLSIMLHNIVLDSIMKI